MKKILIIQTAFLGDVVLATAVAENIHRSFPEYKVSMLVREGNESLLQNHPFVEKVIVWKKKSGKIKSLISVISEVKKEKYDVVINLQRFFSSGLITALSRSPVRAGFNKNPLSFSFTHTVSHVIGDGRHETDRNLQLTEFLCAPLVRTPRLYPSFEDEQKTAEFKNVNYVTMAPASVWFTKQLPEEKWIELIQKIAPGISVYLIGSPSDKELCERIKNNSGSDNIKNLAGQFSLLQTASLMKGARMNYVNDSAPLHITSAMNAPVTAFFCSTVPSFGFGPLSDNSLIIETKVPLSCKPCGLHGYKACPLGHFKCGITIEIPQQHL